MDRAWVPGRGVECGGPNRCMAVPVWISHIAVAVASTSIDLRKRQRVVLVLYF